MPSNKGQITIPKRMRQRYAITRETPILVEDLGNGVILAKVTSLTDLKSEKIAHEENQRAILDKAINDLDMDILMQFARYGEASPPNSCRYPSAPPQ